MLFCKTCCSKMWHLVLASARRHVLGKIDRDANVLPQSMLEPLRRNLGLSRGVLLCLFFQVVHLTNQQTSHPFCKV